MEAIQQSFEERVVEIESYLSLLDAFEALVQQGPPRLGGESGVVVTTVQQRILYSSAYLQLYNLVEATVAKCTEGVCDAILKDGKWRPSDLSSELKKEWVRYIARTHEDLNFDNRALSVLSAVDHLLYSFPVGNIEIEKGGGGNWNDVEIYRFAERIGCALDISREANEAVKRVVRDGLGALGLVVKLRNQLAHGNVSFGECGDGVTVEQLRDLKERVCRYLREVIASYIKFIEDYSYLKPSSRPEIA